jgi:hypothetical protein
LGIPAQASGKNLTRPLMPSAPQPSCYASHRPPTAADDGAAQMTRRDFVWLCIFTPALTHIRENAQPYRFWGLLGFPPRSEGRIPHPLILSEVRPGKTSAILYSANYTNKGACGRRSHFCTHNQGHYVTWRGFARTTLRMRLVPRRHPLALLP